MQKKIENTKPDPPEDCPTAWFAVLERAIRVNDFALADQAQRELDRLGVSVKFGRRKGAAQ